MTNEKMHLTIILPHGVVEFFCNEEIWCEHVMDDLDSKIRAGEMFNEDGWDSVSMSFNGKEVTKLNCKNVIGIGY